MLDKIAAAINQLGIEVEQVHGESAGGQFEVVTAHEDAHGALAICMTIQIAGSSPAHATWLMLCHAQHSLSPCKWLHVACIQVERRDAIARG